MDLSELARRCCEAMGVDYEAPISNVGAGLGRMPVLVRVQNRDEFVWVEGEVKSVEQNAEGTCTLLVVEITPEEQDNVFARIDEDDTPPHGSDLAEALKG
jgi:hypothetical protein